ncbi:MAG: FeoA domain-containing protein, partial [Candidatus Bathyarchaeia archaeon]
VKITYEDYELLRYLNTLGLKPEVPVEVVVKEPSSDLITLRVNENECTLSREVAALIKVRGIEDRNSKFGGLQAWNCH